MKSRIGFEQPVGELISKSGNANHLILHSNHLLSFFMFWYFSITISTLSFLNHEIDFFFWFLVESSNVSAV